MTAPSGQPFNPMWKPPPPPPPVDQSNISPATYVRLISREGHEFFLDRECAKVSRLIKHYLMSLQQGNISGMNSVREVVMDDAQPEGGMITIRLPYTAAPLLEKTVQYFYFKHRYESDPENRPNFHVPHDMAVDLIKVATMLQC